MKDIVAPYEIINKRTYSRKKNVLKYRLDKPTPPEQAIMARYGESFAGKSILDIGCGAGRTAAFIKNLGRKYIGIDYSEEAINVCRKKFPAEEFVHCDVRNMACFETGQFDVVFFPCNGIDSMGSEDRQQAFYEISRVIKDGGLVIFATHNLDFLKESWKGKVPFPSLVWSVKPVRMLRNLKDYLVSAGNYLRMWKYQYVNDKEAMVIGVAYNYGLMTFYIDRNKQIEDLAKADFIIREMYDKYGRPLDSASYAGHSPWIFYVAEKRLLSNSSAQ